MRFAAWTPVSLRSTTANRISVLGVIPWDEESSEEDKTVPSEILVAGVYLCAQPIRRALSQPAQPAGESSVQITLAALAANFPVRDLVAFTAQSSGTLLGAMASVVASASRRFPRGAGTGSLVRKFWQGRQPML